MVEYVYLDAIEPYDKYNLFITENKGQLLKPMRYFDRNFEYVRESPMSVLGRLKPFLRMMIHRVSNHECFSETYDFRLFVFLFYNKVLNYDDEFVLARDTNIIGIVKRLVELKVGSETILNLSGIITYSYVDLVSKCLIYWSSLKAVQERSGALFR
jgi:hypothetical protein